jgi:cysteinyl-tRNA synthetase
VAEIQAKGFKILDLRLLCLKTHYRKPLLFDWDLLESARGERLGWGEAVVRLRQRGKGSAPNPTGSAGYKKRFRDALSEDFDFAGALAAVWDALRPGALSPGSQLGILEEGERVFRLLQDG